MPRNKTKLRQRRWGSQPTGESAPSLKLYQKVNSSIIPSIRRVLQYATTFTMTVTAGLLDRHVFRANSCYDPDLTGVGHQPYGFDQYMALYQFGYVVASRMIVKCINSGLATVSLLSTTSSASPGSTPAAVERGKVNYVLRGNSTIPYMMSTTFNVHQDLHRKNPQDDSTLFFSSAADATDGWYFQLCADDPLSTSSSTIYCICNLEYDVVFLDPALASQS